MQKAIFFDRDGVINFDLGYVHKIKDFIFYSDIFYFLEKSKNKGYKLIIITNQSGIDRQLYSIFDFLKLSKYMQNDLYNRIGFNFDRIYFCPNLISYDRKPNPGMLLKAKIDFNLDFKSCILIGDKLSDLESGLNAGIPIRNLFLINSKSQNKKFNVVDKIIDIKI